MTFLLVSFAVIALADVVPVIYAKKWRTLIAILLVLVPAFALALLQALDVELPSLLFVMGRGFKAMGLDYSPVE